MQLSHTNELVVYTKDCVLPKSFKCWGEAGQAIMNARMANKTPEEAGIDTWIAFETMAFEIIPAITEYVHIAEGAYQYR